MILLILLYRVSVFLNHLFHPAQKEFRKRRKNRVVPPDQMHFFIDRRFQGDGFEIRKHSGIGQLFIRQTAADSFLYGSVGIVADIVISLDIELGQIALSIDLNASTGPSLLEYDKVPGLCHEDGKTYTWQ